MNEAMKTVFGLVGGLAIFLYGMNAMSDALQKTAGEKMKQILAFLTRNPVLGALAGAIVTAVLQSSSATTVMVIGFVSAGLMSLPQAISVIFGANIGTTMTAQLLAFKISNYIYPIIFIGFMVSFLAKKEKMKNIGMVIFSFGLLFEGIEIMGSVMKPLASAPVFISLMEKVATVPVLGVVLGAVMTLLVQSSSATIAVLQNFASQPMSDGVTSVMGLAGAIPILLGDNIGTTITALLASIGQSKNAKRTALSHSVFNITGSVLFLFLLKPYTVFISWFSSFMVAGPEIEIISRQIANAHTCFNIAVTLIWLPLLPVMVRIVNFLVRGEDGDASLYKPRYLNNNVLSHPSAAIYLVSKEISSCSEYVKKLLAATKEEVGGGSVRAADSEAELEFNIVQSLQSAITDYLKKLFAGGGLTELQSEQSAGLLYVTNNLERIGNRCDELKRIMNGIRESGRKVPEASSRSLSECLEMLYQMFTNAIHSVETGDEEEARSVSEDYIKLRKSEKKFRKAHSKSVKEGKGDASLTAEFADIMYTINRIADNCIAVAEETLDEVNFKSLEVPDENLLDVMGETEDEKK